MTLLKLTLITLLSTFIHSAQPAQKPTGIYYGTILEIKDAMGYKYLKVNEAGKETWVAIASAPVAVGEKIGYDKTTMMQDFQSKSLNQKFKKIFFASDVYLSQKVQNPQSMKEMPGMRKDMTSQEEGKPTIPFVKKDAYTIEEIHMWKKSLEGQIIAIEGTVSKVSKGIMKLDWVHLGDGTGNKKELTNDLIFTAKDTTVKTKDKVLAKGKVVVDKDFGFGYFYKVIIQDAIFKVQ